MSLTRVPVMAECSSPIHSLSGFQKGSISEKQNLKETNICFILEKIKHCIANGENFLDLKNCSISKIPDSLHEASNIEYLYLSENRISELPKNFFTLFPRLKWLDLRQNKLSSLPTEGLKLHRNLRALLLSGNLLKTLPIELGHVPSLVTLQVSDNPLQCPSSEEVAKGTKHILRTLSQCGSTIISSGESDNGMDLDIRNVSGSTNHGSRNASAAMEFARNSKEKSLARELSESVCADECWRASKSETWDILPDPSNESFINPENNYSKSAESNKPQQRRRDNAVAILTADRIAQRAIQEQVMERVRKRNIRTENTLQKVRDKNILETFRDETKQMQKQKENMRLNNQLYIPSITEDAPFGISKADLKLLTRDEKNNLEPELRKGRRKVISPQARARIEAKRAADNRNLERRIKEQTHSIMERKCASYGNPQMELEMARRDLETVKELQRQLMGRYKELKQWGNV